MVYLENLSTVHSISKLLKDFPLSTLESTTAVSLLSSHRSLLLLLDSSIRNVKRTILAYDAVQYHQDFTESHVFFKLISVILTLILILKQS